MFPAYNSAVPFNTASSKLISSGQQGYPNPEVPTVTQEFFESSAKPFVKFMTPYEQMLTERQQDERLFTVQNVATPKRATGFLLGGIGVGLLGSLAVGKLFKKQLAKFWNGLAPTKQKIEHKHTFTLNKPIASMFQMFIESPEFRKLIGGYGAATLAGYVGSSFLKGYQEGLVRRAEVSIRSKLLKELNGTFRDSLRIKQQFDNQLLKQAKTDIRSMLRRYGIRQPSALVNVRPLPQSQEAVRRLIYENKPWHIRPSVPANPLVSFNGLFLRNKSVNELTQDIFKLNKEAVQNYPREADPESLKKGQKQRHLMDGLFGGAGVFVGVMAHQLINTFKHVKSKKIKAESESMKTLYRIIFDLDALIVRLKKKPLIVGYGLATGLVLGARLLIDGFREVLVTQMHADTEYQYQKYNWKYLDPSYHATAESEALQDALVRLETDLPKLRYNPEQLQNRIQVILENIGRMSAPKYFLMTPNVGLVEARG